MPPSATSAGDAESFFVKGIIDKELTVEDGFESHLFSIGDYNNAVGAHFKFSYDINTVCVLILSTPDMFDVSFKRWIKKKCEELGSLEAVSEAISSPIQAFLQSRLEPVCEVFENMGVEYELLHDHSLWPNRKPKILMQTCGHIAVRAEGWPPLPMAENKKFIGLSLHPVYGGHFAFRSVFIFPALRFTNFHAPEPLSILKSDDEIRHALERFNYSWKDSGFRDFGGPRKRYSTTQMEYFGRPPAERWSVLEPWCENLRSY